MIIILTILIIILYNKNAFFMSLTPINSMIRVNKLKTATKAPRHEERYYNLKHIFMSYVGN